MLAWEKQAFHKGFSIIIGVDEAGRGPLAGPVVAAACLLKKSALKRFTLPYYKEKIQDSKKLSHKLRERAFIELNKKALFGIGIKDQKYIDDKNIYQSTLDAMRDAIYSLLDKIAGLYNKSQRDLYKDTCVLVDGNMKLALPLNTISIVNGDSLSLSIAGASIIAKVTRDRIMGDYDKIYPLYGFYRHKGYGTKGHMKAIQKYGPCSIHRMTFAPLKHI